MRNRTIRSVLARRPMFANGGMLPPVTQNPMAAGILASSSPLVETVNNQQSPNQGVRVSMKDGGIAKFANGGTTPYLTGRGSYTPSIVIPSGPGENLRRNTFPREVDLRSGFQIDKERSNFLQKAIKLRKQNLDDARPESPGYRTLRKAFSYFTQPAVYADQRKAEEERGLAIANKNLQEIETKPISFWLKQSGAPESVINYYSDTSNIPVGYRGDFAQDGVVASLNIPPKEGYGQTGVDSVDPEFGFGPQASPFEEIREIYPFIDDESAAEILNFKEQNPGVTIEQLVTTSFPSDVVEEFKFGPEPDELGFTGTEDEVVIAEGPEESGGVDNLDFPGTDDLEGSPLQGKAEVEPKDKAEVKPQDAATKMINETKQALEGKLPQRKPGIPADSKEGESKEDPVENTIKDIANTVEKKNPKTIEDFKEEFKKAVGSYEGMSEEEKGFTILEAGLRVMAGKDPNAIVNIGEGLKGITKEFVKDKAAKRAYDRQIDLSGAKYGLERVNELTKLDRADERSFEYYYDVSKKTKDNPYGKLVAVSRKQLIENGGQLPANLRQLELIKADIVATKAATTKLQTILLNNAEDFKIGSVEADRFTKELGKAAKTLENSKVGIGLLGNVKEQLAKGNITGVANAGKELIRRGFAFIGKDLDKGYKNVSQARANIKKAFQSLIPVALGEVQSANSISNRDVTFLADAFINSGFLNDGVFDFATIDDKALASALEGAMGKFREGEDAAMATYNRIIGRLTDAESRISSARAAGVPVSRGPFTRSYFGEDLERVAPYVSRLKNIRTETKKKGTLFGELEGYKPIYDKDGKFQKYVVRPQK